MILSRPNIRYKSPYIPYLLNYLLIWVKTVTYFYEPYYSTRAGINISTQIKNSVCNTVCNTVWNDLEENRCFKHPPSAKESIRSIGPDSPLEKRLTSL